MANKPLQSIKFPGLSDTYTVPQVDSVPTQGSTNAVSSGGVYNSFNANRSGTIEYNPLAYYGYSADNVSAVDFSTMPLNTYIYVQFSIVKDALLNANFPLSWDDSDYVSMARYAAGRTSVAVSVIKLYNFTKKESIEMLYFATTIGNKYRWVLPSTDFTKQYLPAEAKAVGDALAQKADLSSLIAGRNNIVILPWGGISKSDIGDTIDFRTLPLGTYCFTQYSYIKQSLLNTNMPDNDWSDDDYVAIFRGNAHKSSTGVSIITLYNFSKTRKLEMLYFATAVGNKYRWLTHGVIQNINNSYTYNQYSNSYEITASPTITADTNNYLASTGDNTDRTADIVTLLTQTGVCNLGPGVFYVSGIDMPNDSCINGSGSATKIVLLDSVMDGYAIKMGSRCIVKNCTIVGGSTEYGSTSTIGTRHGVVWIGTATTESITSPTPVRGTISNCYISNFSGGGIYCQGTGTGISNCLNVINVYIYNCTVGVYIPLLSEFHRFTNVDCRGCYYGNINNGGNNVFANCGFSKNIIGVMIDAQSNSAHGSYVGCVINHSGSNNDGIAIKLINISPKEIFTGCQIYYGSVDIENCKGIVFNACNFGSDIPINITNGKTVLFSSCVFTSQPVITKVNNINTHFANCYTREDDIVTV